MTTNYDLVEMCYRNILRVSESKKVPRLKFSWLTSKSHLRRTSSCTI